MMMKNKFSRIHFSQKRNNWKTPAEAYKDLDSQYHFDLDPCIPSFTGFKGDGLRSNWYGNVFINPEYDDIPRWINKGWIELCANRCKLTLFLLPSRTGTGWMEFLKKRNAEFQTIRGRLKFDDSGNGAPFDSLIAILRRKNVLQYWRKLGI